MIFFALGAGKAEQGLKPEVPTDIDEISLLYGDSLLRAPLVAGHAGDNGPAGEAFAQRVKVGEPVPGQYRSKIDIVEGQALINDPPAQEPLQVPEAWPRRPGQAIPAGPGSEHFAPGLAWRVASGSS